MFAGLVEELGQVVRLIPCGPGTRIEVAAKQVAEDPRLGDSIAINGCCLTVIEIQAGGVLAFEAGPETLVRTNLGRLQPGSHVNLERSLQIGDRLGGHFVTGHIDAVGILDRRLDDDQWSTFWFRVPAELTRQMASKGSVAVDGVSLTLVDVQSDCFSVALIPHTLGMTTLGQLQPQDQVNIETDLLAKYVQQQIRSQP